MDIWSSAFVSMILVASSIGLMVWHQRSWKEIQSRPTEPRELKFHSNQHRRRMQTSAMLGVLGIAILLGQLSMHWVHSGLFTAIYWVCVLLLVAWMALLAIADIWVTQHHFSRLRTDYLIERAKLQAEARRLEAASRNGNDEPWLRN